MNDGLRGAYSADRASALSGVPISTVYYWASHDIVTPSLAHVRPKLWTYNDVIALRIVQWLRRDKHDAAKTSMPEVRKALRGLDALGASLASPEVQIRVDRSGRIVFSVGDSQWRAVGSKKDVAVAGVLPGALDPLAEFVLDDDAHRDSVGPNLRQPREHLRIIPGKLGGEPHVDGTRISSLMVADMIREGGYKPATVRRLYPMLTEQQITECVDLEEQLSRNLAA